MRHPPPTIELQTSRALREAFRLKRRADDVARRYSFYMEHGLLQEALRTRVVLLHHLRDARGQWRTALGLDP
jgi:hypothetical protein